MKKTLFCMIAMIMMTCAANAQYNNHGMNAPRHEMHAGPHAQAAHPGYHMTPAARPQYGHGAPHHAQPAPHHRPAPHHMHRPAPRPVVYAHGHAHHYCDPYCSYYVAPRPVVHVSPKAAAVGITAAVVGGILTSLIVH